MKFLRFICNILLFFAVTFGISIIQLGVYDVIAAQDGFKESVDEPSINAIHIAGDENEISYLDSYGFWFTDIRTNFKQDAKYRVRNWGSAKWWKKVGKGPDFVIDCVAATIKPIVVPIAQVNALKQYYKMTINSPKIETNILYNEGNDITAANDALYELYVIFPEFGLDNGYHTDPNGKEIPIYTFGDEKILIQDYKYDPAKYAEKVEEIDKVGVDIVYARWVKEHKALYNNNWKLVKYNYDDNYKTYYKKFIKEVGDTRAIKTSVVVLYYQQFVSIILAIFFVIKYPVNLFQARVESKKNRKETIAVH